MKVLKDNTQRSESIMFSKEARARLSTALRTPIKEQCKAWRRVQPEVQKQMVEYLQGEFDLIPVYYAVLAEAVVEEVVSVKVKSVPANAPDIFVSDKDWIESLLIDSKSLLLKWDESGKAEQVLDDWERKQESIKHGI